MDVNKKATRLLSAIIYSYTFVTASHLPKSIMKKYLMLLMLIFFYQFSMGSLIMHTRNYHNPTPEYLKTANFIKMSPSEFEVASGHKLSFAERLYFKKIQRRLAKTEITADATISKYYDQEKGKFKLDMVWFVLGLIIGPFAILFSYTSKQSKVKRTSALIGTVGFIIWFGWLFLF